MRIEYKNKKKKTDKNTVIIMWAVYTNICLLTNSYSFGSSSIEIDIETNIEVVKTRNSLTSL